MNRDENIDKIRLACFEADSDRNWQWLDASNEQPVPEYITLADILLAVVTKRESFYYGRHQFGRRQEAVSGTEYICDIWDLRRDDLAAQSNECLEFIASILDNAASSLDWVSSKR
jgi:hypothetical protein